VLQPRWRSSDLICNRCLAKSQLRWPLSGQLAIALRLLRADVDVSLVSGERRKTSAGLSIVQSDHSSTPVAKRRVGAAFTGSARLLVLGPGRDCKIPIPTS
jgi:hypothetical protein